VYTFHEKTRRKATDRHLPYRIAQCYLPSDTSSLNAPHLNLSLNLPRRGRRL